MARLKDTEINGNLNVSEDVQIGDISVLDSLGKLKINYYGETSRISYTTASWSPGTGGYSWTVPKTGWYYLRSQFASGSGQMTEWQFQVFKNTNAIDIYGTVGSWNGTMPIHNLNGIHLLEAGDIIHPYIHTATEGVIINTKLYYVLLQEL